MLKYPIWSEMVLSEMVVHELMFIKVNGIKGTAFIKRFMKDATISKLKSELTTMSGYLM